MWLATQTLALLLFQAAPANPLDAAAKALEEQRWEAAAESAKAAVAKDAKSAPGYYYLGFALSMMRRDDEAVAAYRQALALKSDLAPAHLNLGLVLLRQKNYQEALTHLEQASAGPSPKIAAVLGVGDAQAGLGRFADAEATFRKAAGIDATSGAAELGIGQALAKQGKLTEAEAHYRKAGELDPAYAESLLELASLYEAAKQTKEAASLFLRFPGNPIARERAGELLLESGDAEAAIPHLEAAVAGSPTSTNRYALATAYTIQKQYPKAEALLAEILKTDPSNYRFRMMLGRIYREQRNFAAAAKEFYRAAETTQDSAEAWGDLAGMLVLLEQDQTALQALNKVRELRAEKPVHHFFRAILFDRQKMAKEALASYEQFLAQSKDQYPDEEFKARQRVRILQKEIQKR